MEHKINQVIAYNFKGKIIYLKVMPSRNHSCKNCFFYPNTNCSDIKNIVGHCTYFCRNDNTSVIFKQINK